MHVLGKSLGVKFHDQKLLERALVHRSFLNENPEISLDSNERLEFLGDAVLGLVVGHALYVRCPDLAEGELTSLRAALVQRQTLAQISARLRLGDYLLLGRGEDSSGGRQRQSNLANVIEALIGAVFLDQGYQAAQEFTLGFMAPDIDTLLASDIPKDPKSRLQELLQSTGGDVPVYRIMDLSGPEHNRRFIVEVIVSDKVLGVGSSRRKVDAERQAAMQAIRELSP